MRAIFQIIANAQDMTDLLKDRLISLQLTDQAGLQSDECEIRLDDRDDRIAFPRKGAQLRISLGWEGQGLLSNVWCGHCRHETTITNFSGTIKGGDLLLVGKCAECRSDVARVIEGS